MTTEQMEQMRLQKAVRQFMDNRSGFRLHISHNDLDGYACSVVSEVIDLYIKPGEYRNPISYVNVDYNTSLQSVVSDWIEDLIKSTNYTAGTMPLTILVTDLSNVNPCFITRFQNEGHSITLCVVDHHGLNPDKAKIIDPSLAAAYHVYDTSQCAAYQYYQEICRGYHLGNGSLWSNVGNYVRMVNRWDMGDFGEWDSGKNTISEQLREQIEFTYFVSTPAIPEEYTRMKANLLIWPSYHNRVYTDIALMVDKFLEFYQTFVSWIAPIASDAGRVNLVGDNYGVRFHVPTVKIYGFIARTSEMDTRYYSVYAAKYLEEHPEVDFLAKISLSRKTVELRSRTGSNNDCRTIAIANGGGGHKHAAGFTF